MALNTDIADGYISHSILLERFTASELRKTRAFLKRVENGLIAELNQIDPSSVNGTWRTKRLNALIKSARKTTRNTYAKEYRRNKKELVRLAGVEQKAGMSIVNGSLGAPLMTVALTANQLRAVVSNAIFEGAPTKEWWSRQSQATANRFSDVVRRGINNGYSNAKIARMVRGTKAHNFTNGIMNTSKREAESLVRGSVQAVSTAARLDLFNNNTDVLKGVQQRSTLDSRTSDICIAYSNLQWSLPGYAPIGHGLPFDGGTPRHWNCRSNIIPVTRSWSELSGRKISTPAGGQVKGPSKYFARQLSAKGLKGEPLAKAKSRVQAALDGQVADDLNYEQWLDTKSASFQKKTLGPAKYRLWKKGRLTLRDLVDETGRPLSIDELEELYG